MSLARKYRLRFGAARGDRVLFYLVVALSVHAGAATSAYLAWQDWQATPPEPEVTSTPVEFIYLDTEDSLADDTERRAQSDAKAQGTRLANRPINAGKEAATAAQKASLSESSGKPVDANTLGLTGEVIPAQHGGTGSTPTPLPASLPPAPVDETKAIASDPPPLQASPLTAPIPDLPSEVPLPSIEDPIPTVEPSPQTRILPEPPPIPSPIAPPETASLPPEMLNREAIAPPQPEPSVQTEEPGPNPQPIPATAGLEGIPNPDRQAEDGPVQVAARRDEALGDYVAQVNAQIYEVWDNISMDVSRQARVRFEVDRQGNLMMVELTQPSGSDAADQAALEAIRRAAPFQPFSAAIANPSLRINLTFHYNVANSSPSPATDPLN